MNESTEGGDEEAGSPPNEPVERCEASGTLNKPEASCADGARPPRYPYLKLLVRRMYDAQKVRISSNNRFERLIREGKIIREVAEGAMRKALDLEVTTEKAYERLIWQEVKDLPIISEWAMRVKGVGPRISGLCVALVDDPARFEHCGKLWAYAGFAVHEGKALRFTRGVQANWCNELKLTCLKAARGFVKLSGKTPIKYHDLIYRPYKNRIILRTLAAGEPIWERRSVGSRWTIAERDGVLLCPKELRSEDVPPPDRPDWTLGHIEAMAVRYTAKMFLSNFWEAWRKLDGLPVVPPYSIVQQGHVDWLDPWTMLD